MTPINKLGNKVPGFDFLQGLMKSAGSAIPGMSSWIAPTLDPDELNKRIEELRTVQFWLEQNAKLIATTIQALEVQRMTLSTLKNLNVQVGDITEAMKLQTPSADADAASAEAAHRTKSSSKAKGTKSKSSAAAGAAAGLVDPMQWWGALTQQFSELAAQAVKDSGAEKVVEAAANLPAQAMQAARTAAERATGASNRKTTPASTRKAAARRKA